MQLTFRWFGEDDSIGLDRIRQIPGVRGVVSALYDLQPGDSWPEARLERLRANCESAGLEFRVVESIPVHEEIKLGGPDRDRLIETWIRNIHSVAKVLGPVSRCSGSEAPIVITYNFMPVFDWTRSDLEMQLPDGSNALAYDAARIDKMDPLEGELELPGWLARYQRHELLRLMNLYRERGSEDLWENLEYFLEAVIPAAEEANVRLAIHPDDPPWPIFNLPRIVVDESSLHRLISIIDSPANGICLCSGSLGADPVNDIPKLVREFAPRIAFAHLRNVRITGEHSFAECAHWTGSGSLDMAAIVLAYAESGWDGPLRPDHGRMIWGEKGKPGYGLYDRAIGAEYILGLFEAMECAMLRKSGK